MTELSIHSEALRAIVERRERVAELTKAGKSERAIAAELRVSRTTVWTDKQVNAAAGAATRQSDG